MKKTILSILAFTCFAISAMAQIPNAGFENWTTMSGYSNPDGWGTMNNTTASNSVYTASMGTPGNPGSSYLKLISRIVGANVVNGMAVSGKLDSVTMQPISGFAFNMRPKSLTGSWQYMNSGSAGSVNAILSRWDNGQNKRVTVATANKPLSGMAMSWANFSIDFTYVDGNNPDTCIITLKASGLAPASADYLYVDNLAFTGTVAGVEDNTDVISNMNLYPNPSSNFLTINFTLAKSQNVTLSIIDIFGKIVKDDNLGIINGNAERLINTNNLAKGTYFVSITTETASEIKKIVIE